MFEPQQDHEDQKEKPGDRIEDEDIGCDRDDNSRNPPGFRSKKSISDMTPVKLTNGKQVECSYKKANPSGISKRMNHHNIGFWNMPQ